MNEKDILFLIVASVVTVIGMVVFEAYREARKEFFKIIPKISEQEFRNALYLRICSDLWERALNVFRDYGEDRSYDVMHVLCYAAEQEKTEKVLDILEKHLKKTISGDPGFDPAADIFVSIYQDTLGIKVEIDEGDWWEEGGFTDWAG